MNIRLTVISENPDGSANANVKYDEEGLQFLVQEGVTSVLKQYIEQQKKENGMDNAWEISNELESISYRISNAKDVLELIAVDLANEPQSGATWAVRDMLKNICKDLNEQADKFMDIHKANKVAETTPKKAKKK